MHRPEKIWVFPTLDSKVFHWSKRPKYCPTSVHTRKRAKIQGPNEIIMDETSMWIPTWQAINTI